MGSVKYNGDEKKDGLTSASVPSMFLLGVAKEFRLWTLSDCFNELLRLNILGM